MKTEINVLKYDHPEHIMWRNYMYSKVDPEGENFALVRTFKFFLNIWNIQRDSSFLR